MAKLKLYLETSVWNFYYADDAPEKKEITVQFFENLPNSDFEIYISDMVVIEISRASEAEQERLSGLIAKFNPVRLHADDEVESLANQYIFQKILPQKSIADATHIAVATVNELNAVVSWNMRHIASLRKQEKVQAINLLNGFTKPLQLITPYEVSEKDTDEG
ncbi:hypothetical protein WDW89_20805 [Deltaproteobacteria bacterium TL4]